MSDVPLPIEPAEERKAKAVGWLMQVIERVEKQGARGLALVHIHDDGTLGTIWTQFSPMVPGTWAGLVAGAAVLQNRLVS